jgi:hypothetical protein
MAQKQDPPKKTMKDLLKKISKSGDRASASSSFTARAAKKVAMGAGKALKSIAAKKDSTSNPILNRINSIMGAKKGKPNTVKIDSTKKVMPIGGPKSSITIKKQTTIKPTKPDVIKLPYKPVKKAIIKKIMK